MSLRRLGIAVAVVTLTASGAYVFIYLARWEWNRAILAGILFLATEVALATVALLHRVRALEHLMERRRSDERAALARVREAAPPPKPRLQWLDTDGPAVFVPVLMGVGVVVSVMAMAVERVAQRTALPVLERRLADRMAPLMLGSAGERATGKTPAKKRGRPALQMLLLLGLTAAVAAGIDFMADLTQTRPDAVAAGTRTSLIVEVEADRGSREPLTIATRLWAVCGATVPSHLTRSGIEVTGEHTVGFEVEPALGEHQTERLVGCFEDMTLDYVRADVQKAERLPED